MKEFLVDVPVKINIWIREDCFRKQFDIIKKACPSILFVQSDGGRNNVEWASILKNRQIIDNEIDWNCQVYKLYMEENNGLYGMSQITKKLIWSTVDRCIFLEDDDIPSVSFFRFCKELLDKYENDYRVQGICGFNPLNECKEVTSDYFFTAMWNPWGTATWKRASELLTDGKLSYFDDTYTLSLMKKLLNNSNYKMAINCARDKKYNGHVPSSEFYHGIGRITQNALFIFPKYNLISNEGCSMDSEHSNSYKVLSNAEKKLFYSKTYEYRFPLKHPEYMISNVVFQRRVRALLGNYNPIKKFYRRIVKGIKTIYFLGPQALVKKIKKTSMQRHSEK